MTISLKIIYIDHLYFNTQQKIPRSDCNFEAESQAKTSRIPSMGSSDAKYPWPSTVNVANFVTVKPCLEEKEWLINFITWKKQMVCLLESQGVLGFVNGEIRPPQEDNAAVPADEISSNEESDEQKLWRRTDRLVQGWILGSIGNDALRAVCKLETAAEVWSELDKIFNQKAAIPEIVPECSTSAQEEGGGGSTEDYLQRVDELQKAVKSVRCKLDKIFSYKERDVAGIAVKEEGEERSIKNVKLDEIVILNQTVENAEIQHEGDNNAQEEGEGYMQRAVKLQKVVLSSVRCKLGKILSHKAENLDLTPREADTNAQEEAETGQESNGYSAPYRRPIHGACFFSDVPKNNFSDKDKKKAEAILQSHSSETPLHEVVMEGDMNNIVKLWVEKMSRDELAQRNIWGDTALHYAAMFGNTEAARILVSKNPDLLCTVNCENQLPIQIAARHGRKHTLEYLITLSKNNVERSTFQGLLGIRLLIETINSKCFDVALDLVETYPDLARCDENSSSALLALAKMSSVFPSAERFSWWQKFMYCCIPIQRPKRKVSQAKSVAGAPPNKKFSSLFQILSVAAQKFLSMICLVPQVKDTKIKKATHQQALELVKLLCQHIKLSSPEKEAWITFHTSIIMAAKLGISEIVEVILDNCPLAIFAQDENNMNIILLAASNRFENVFNLIYSRRGLKNLISLAMDNRGNNLMHICGKLALPNRLNLAAGAALQMQRELQWFKKMEELVHPSWRTRTNNEKDTPRMIFTKEHEKLKAEGEKWMKDTSKACTIAAVLIATVVFAAAFTVPGGIEPKTGFPIFSNRFAFMLFAISDAVSLFTSITSLLMFLSILTSRYKEEDFLYVLPRRLSIGLLSLFISITFMMVAFSATLYLVFRGKLARFLIPVAALACLPVTSFVVLKSPLLVDVVYSSFGPGIFGKRSNRILY